MNCENLKLNIKLLFFHERSIETKKRVLQTVCVLFNTKFFHMNFPTIYNWEKLFARKSQLYTHYTCYTKLR